MRCPHCNIDLLMAERSGVEIDYCPQCRGIWLDRGELDKLIERSSLGGEEEGDERTGGKERKRSFWREIFDFD